MTGVKVIVRLILCTHYVRPSLFLCHQSSKDTRFRYVEFTSKYMNKQVVWFEPGSYDMSYIRNLFKMEKLYCRASDFKVFYHAVYINFFYFVCLALHCMVKCFIYLQILFLENYICMYILEFVQLYALFLLHGGGCKYKQDLVSWCRRKCSHWDSGKLGQSTNKIQY